MLANYFRPPEAKREGARDGLKHVAPMVTSPSTSIINTKPDRFSSEQGVQLGGAATLRLFYGDRLVEMVSV